MQLCFWVERIPVGACGRRFKRVEERLLLCSKSGEQVGVGLEPLTCGNDVDVVGEGSTRDGLSVEAWKEYFFATFEDGTIDVDELLRGPTSFLVCDTSDTRVHDISNAPLGQASTAKVFIH